MVSGNLQLFFKKYKQFEIKKQIKKKLPTTFIG